MAEILKKYLKKCHKKVNIKDSWVLWKWNPMLGRNPLVEILFSSKLTIFSKLEIPTQTPPRKFISQYIKRSYFFSTEILWSLFSTSKPFLINILKRKKESAKNNYVGNGVEVVLWKLQFLMNNLKNILRKLLLVCSVFLGALKKAFSLMTLTVVLTNSWKISVIMLFHELPCSLTSCTVEFVSKNM